MEKDPDSTFIDGTKSNTENHELQCILNYFFPWRFEDRLKSTAEAFFSCPPSYMCSVKTTGEQFRGVEVIRKIAYQGFLERKNL